MTAVLLVTGTVIITMEIALWILLRRQLRTLRLPYAMDRSSIRSFSSGKIYVLPVIHTFFLLATSLIPLWLLW